MNGIFLGKIWAYNKENLVFLNGEKYSLVEDFFPEVKSFSKFLNLLSNKIKINERDLKNKIPSDVKFLDLIEDQHIFATGCTYQWSAEQLASTSDDDVYKMLYLNERSMFFYKGNKLNCAKNFESIGVRTDAKITIPEAELVAVFNFAGEIVGYSIGNDVTALDLEKQNPLYQAQAKFYKGSVALLPLIKLGSEFPNTNLKCSVLRKGKSIVETTYNTQNFNRNTEELLKQLKRSELNPSGGFLFLGCGIPYPVEFGLIQDDSVKIESDIFPISLQNTCAKIG
jgi:2-dehydro-3-deoxy-D-arabinonate dehydratase